MAAVTIHSDSGAQGKKNLSLVPLFSLLFAMKWWDQMPRSLFIECWLLSQLFHSLLTLIKRLYSPLHFLPVVSSVYLRLLIFLPVIFIPAWDSPSLAFCMMYSAYKLNKQGDNTCHLLVILLAFCMMYSAYKLNKQGDNTCHLLVILLSQFGTSQLFHVRFYCFLTCI